jgi:hypothetical protein
MDYRAKVQEALDDHNPRPPGDPLYVPYWAKGSLARAGGYRYTMQDGSEIHAGRIARLGKEAPPSASSGPELPKYPTRVERPTERVPDPKKGVDRVGELLRQHRTRESRMELCRVHGVDWSIVEGAPNAGVGAMRLANALRSKLG